MNRRDAAWLLALSLVFLIWHLPLEYRTAAGQDEDWYAIPGSMILRGGLPRIPYVPARDPGSAGYMADRVLYALPPFHYYLQAMTQVFVGDGVGPSRVASTLMGLLAVFLVYQLALVWFGDGRVGVLAASAFIFSRAFLFPATMARPDMTAAACGLCAAWLILRARGALTIRVLISSGVMAGLSLLSHPFGVIPAVQAGVAILLRRGTLVQRLRRAAVFSVAAIAVWSLWLPLIALHPDWFRAQFGANVTSRAGPGLFKTLLSPQSILAYQVKHFWTFVQPPQGLLYATALAWAAVRSRAHRIDMSFLGYGFGAAFLMILLQGRHPAVGYYVYPVAFFSIAAGFLLNDLGRWLERVSAGRGPSTRWIAGNLSVIAIIIMFLPGAGLKNFWAHARHANDPNYNSPEFSRLMMANLPKSSLIAVDGAYVVDFYLAGWNVIDLTIHPLTLDVREHPFEFAVLGRQSLRLFKPLMDDLILERVYGTKDDLFSEYAEVYRRGPSKAKAGR